MSATITRIPVAMKRGRKVTRGPLASIVHLHPSKPPSVLERSNKAHVLLAQAALALDIIRKSGRQREWVDLAERKIMEAADLFADITRPLIDSERQR